MRRPPAGSRGPTRGAGRGRPFARCPALPLLLGAAVAFASCGEGADSGSLALRELERLAFLPSGKLDLPPWVFQIEEPLLVDMFEITRDDWRWFQGQAGAGEDPDLRRYVDSWAPGTGRWPAAFMTFDEARAFAAWRGMRLLAPGEWLWCAMGPNRWSYPWGTTPQESVANTLELGLERPAPVGTFESGRNPLGCYDLLGNVAEWVDGALPATDLQPGDERVSAVGGSFRTWRSPIYDETARRRPTYETEFLATALHPGSRRDHVGLRCCAPAERYLWERAPDWGSDESTLRRLDALGRRWGRQASPLLQDLAARPGAPAGLGALAEGARR